MPTTSDQNSNLYLLPMHPIRAAIVKAMERMDQDIRPTRLGQTPRVVQLACILEDLAKWAEISDAVTLAFGEYVRERVGGISDADMQQCFRNQLWGALDGNATTVISNAYDQWRDDQ